MIRLMTALLTLGVIITTATTAIAAEPEGWCYCNPEAPLCRIICPDRPVVNAFDHHRHKSGRRIELNRTPVSK